MRLLYNYVVGKISRRHCGIVVEYLKSRVATGLEFNQNQHQDRTIPNDVIYKFITTSRPVEEWLQVIDKSIKKIAYELYRKEPTELWMVIGGYGAGKSHMKQYILEVVRKTKKVESIALEVADLLQSDLNPTSGIDNIYSLTLLQTTNYLDALYEKISDKEHEMGSLKEKIWEYLPDNEFIEIFSNYGKVHKDNRGDFDPLRNIIINKGSRLFLPLMKLYKKYLGIDGVFITIDEFEDLQNLIPETRQRRFFESIRAFYDTLAKAYQDFGLPSFKMVILCTLSYWEELAKANLSQGLETRVQIFEIPQLVEDEIVAMAEKLHELYKKSGKLKHDIQLDFTKTPKYIAEIAGIEKPLTPRFVIQELIRIIEEPAKYIGFTSQGVAWMI